uniref:ZZ-type zinc finger-containing protein 3 n=1 Tax=Strigamia maritima TaxID=126957 RepID=T1JA06_STRMM
MMNDHDYCSVSKIEENQKAEASVTQQIENICLNEVNLEKIKGALSATETTDNKLNSLANLLEDSTSQSSLVSSQSGQASSSFEEKISNFEAPKLEETNLIQPVKDRNEIDDNIGEYYFETDHLALRGNEDYLALLKTIAVLEGQRTKAINDLDCLHRAQEKILANPIEFVEKLQRKEDLNLPNPQVLAQLPCIDWDKYTRSFSPHAFNHRHKTRNKPSDMTKSAADVMTSLAAEPANNSSSTQLFKGDRPHSFNQPWSIEEQKLLVELLNRFPSENIESRRWEKIAQALGNRTQKQVASRVQKYFIKLKRLGYDVPGRAPNITNYNKKGSGHRHQRHNRYLYPKTTFLVSYEPPVLMNDNDDDTMSSYTTNSGDDDDDDDGRRNEFSDEESVPVEIQNSSDYKELKMLQRLRKRTAQSEGLAVHDGFKCEGCDCKPIIGTRWHCLDCEKTDLCNSCANSSSGNKPHDSKHHMQPIEISHGFMH